MPTKADSSRVQKLRALKAQAGRESWSNERLDEELAKLYGSARARKKAG